MAARAGRTVLRKRRIATKFIAWKEKTSGKARTKETHILVIVADDIGWFNVSCYNQGIMGYRTPNIDRIAKEGAMSPISTASRAVPPAEPHSSPAIRRFAPASPIRANDQTTKLTGASSLAQKARAAQATGRRKRALYIRCAALPVWLSDFFYEMIDPEA